MILRKSCGKCGGDVNFETERHGVEVYCLHCGSRKFFTPSQMRALSTGARSTVHEAAGSRTA